MCPAATSAVAVIPGGGDDVLDVSGVGVAAVTVIGGMVGPWGYRIRPEIGLGCQFKQYIHAGKTSLWGLLDMVFYIDTFCYDVRRIEGLHEYALSTF